MDELSTNRAFVQVVESGSFSAAARDLNISVTSVARQVTDLEARLGVQLLNRTTRHHSLTEPGRFYYDQVVELVRQYDLLKREAASYQKGVKGCLRVHLRSSIGNQIVVPALPRFLANHPDVTMDVTLTDERADLVSLGIDVAVWLGELEDSTLIARRLTRARRVVCASPGYIERHGLPQAPEDLRDHNCIVYRARNYDNVWRLTKGDRTIPIVVSGNLQTVSPAVLLTSAVVGLGIVVLQESMVREAMRGEKLIHILPEYSVSSTEADVGIYAVYPGGRRVSPKARAFIDFLVALFRDQDGPG